MIEFYWINIDSDFPEIRIEWINDADNYRGIMDQLDAQQLGWS